VDSLRYSAPCVCLTEPGDQVLSFRQASPTQQRSALRCLETDLQPAFSHLTFLDWAQAFYRVEPDLNVLSDGCVVTYPSLLVLVRYFTHVLPSPPPVETSNGPLTLYLAEKLRHCAILLEGILASYPPPPDSLSYRVLTELAAGDARAQQVCNSLDWLPLLSLLAPPTPAAAAPSI
jgi:hypothetical protein